VRGCLRITYIIKVTKKVVSMKKTDWVMAIGSYAFSIVVLALIVGVMVLSGCSKKKTNIEVLDFAPAVEDVKEEPKNVQPVVMGEKLQPVVVEESKKITIYFDFDKANLKVHEAMKLDKLVGIKQPVKVLGYTCNIGTDEWNMALSWARAKAVTDYLGYGEPVGLGENYCDAPCVSVDEQECAECRKVIVWRE